MLTKEQLKEIDATAINRAKERLAERNVHVDERDLELIAFGIALGSSITLDVTREVRVAGSMALRSAQEVSGE